MKPSEFSRCLRQTIWQNVVTTLNLLVLLEKNKEFVETAPSSRNYSSHLCLKGEEKRLELKGLTLYNTYVLVYFSKNLQLRRCGNWAPNFNVFLLIIIKHSKTLIQQNVPPVRSLENKFNEPFFFLFSEVEKEVFE